MANQINPQSVIPKYWSGVYATLDEELSFYSLSLLQYLVEYWREVMRSCDHEIEHLGGYVDFLSTQTVATLREVAAEYENPVFSEIGIRHDGFGGNPEPLDADSISRERETTTLNVCGWCKFTAGGTCRGTTTLPPCATLPLVT